jgi:hypothetical protein
MERSELEPSENYHDLPSHQSLPSLSEDATTTSDDSAFESMLDDERRSLDDDDDDDDDGDGVRQDALSPSQPEEASASNPPPPFSVGDHVYQWCDVVGIPMFQHHGIVMGVHWDDTDEEWFLHISDFSNLGLHESSSASENGGGGASLGASLSNPFRLSKKGPGGWRSYASPAAKWRRVLYNATWWEKAKSRSGTCTSADCDPPGVVQARVRFLQEHSATLLDMPYHWLHANCECVAVWCKTGAWATLQALSFLATAAASQAKSAAVMTGTAVSTQVAVTAPAAGMWGWLGYTTTTQVSLLATQPWIIPALVTYGVMTIGIPAVMMLKAQKEWKRTTSKLNDEFWAHAAVDQQHLFVECIMHWKQEEGD